MQNPEQYATKRRAGCILWLAILAVILSTMSLMADISQELAWDARMANLRNVPAVPVVDNAASSPDITASSTEQSPSDPTFAHLCDVDADNMTEVQLQQYADSLVGQNVANWTGYVYDVEQRNDTYNLLLASEPRGLLWSRDIVVEDVPADIAVPLNVEQPVNVSGRIAQVGVFLHTICNPVTLQDATVTPQ